MILDPVGHSVGGNEIDSTGELLCKINELNSEANLVESPVEADEKYGTTSLRENSRESVIGPALQAYTTV